MVMSMRLIKFLTYCKATYPSWHSEQQSFREGSSFRSSFFHRHKPGWENLAGLVSARSMVDVCQPPLRRAPVNCTHIQAHTRGPCVVPLSEDMWEKLEEWYSRGRTGRGGADRAKRERRSMGGEAENEELNRGRKIEPAEEGRNLGMKGCRI